MVSYYWKVIDSTGALIHTSARYSDRTVGRDLRRRYPIRHGYSVRRVTVRPVARTAAPVGFFARVRAAFGW